MHIANDHDRRVAVIGGGPAGLVSARWLLSEGFEPIIFEAAPLPGGHWSGAQASAAWPGMRTNTSRIMTAFSDLEHAPEVASYPTAQQMGAYLARYAATFGLTDKIRLRTRVTLVERSSEGWRVTTHADGRETTETFANVIVASGRQNCPSIPQIAGLDRFTGALGAVHSAQYGGAERYRGAKVLVAGCSISALEIATDLAASGVEVEIAYRRQRYIVPKLIAGIPAEHVLMTRASALAGETLPPEAIGAGLKQAILKAGGSPEQWGARKPDPDVFVAGVAQAQGFLPAVAEGRIRVREWIEGIEGRTIRFTDGQGTQADAIILGTGYRLSLPWLAPEIAQSLGLDDTHIDLHAHTFHPDLPGLAFVGLYDMIGPYFPVLELQARWIAYTMSRRLPVPCAQELCAGLEATRAARGGPQSFPMQHMALLFARAAQVEPDLDDWPELERALLFGPLSPASFRIDGPDQLPDAARRTLAAAGAFGHITSADPTPDERLQRDLLRQRLAVA